MEKPGFVWSYVAPLMTHPRLAAGGAYTGRLIVELAAGHVATACARGTDAS